MRIIPIIVGVLLALYPLENSMAQVSEGDKAVPFSGQDLQGNPIDIAPLIGKQVIVLKFGSIYCSTCVQAITAFSELQKRHSTEDLKVVGINLDIYGTFRVKRFYRGYADLVRFPVLIDKGLKISSSYGVATLPSVVIIDKDGKVVRVMMGYQEEELEAAVQLAENLLTPRAVVTLAGTGQGNQDELRILFPINFTNTKQDSIYIVGSVPTLGSQVTLTLNGSSRQELVTERDQFYFRTPVTLGSNYIEVSTVGTDGVKITKAIVMFREPKLGRGFENQFPLYRFHLEENERKCEKCHDLEPPQSTEQTFMMITRMCLECHKELGQKAFVHGPITVGGCTPCHDFASLPGRYELFTLGADLCYGCHQEKEEEFSKSYLHGPLAAGICTICHSPHGSNERYNLRLPQGQMCLSCHHQIREHTSRFSKHPPFDEGKCAGCHNPHASNNPKFFLNHLGDDLCYSCHDEQAMEGHKHPVGVVPNFSFPSIGLNDLGELMCTSCHNPHASDGDQLLPEKGCGACHIY